MGQGPNPLVQSTTPGLNTTKWGNIVTDDSGLTSRPGLYAGGDVVRGGSTVILAMGDGKRAAASIQRWLNGEPLDDPETAAAEPAAGVASVVEPAVAVAQPATELEAAVSTL